MSSRPRNLRVSYVWRDEVMSDKVLDEPGAVTLGSDGKSTITAPELGLPAGFAILRPGQRGYVLTLGVGMGGRVQLDGQEMEVEDFLARQGADRTGAQGAFKATGVGGGDWGVIHLDGRGDHVLFFQFVEVQPPLPRSQWRDADQLLPALAFALILHGVFITYAYTVGQRNLGFLWPGNRELVADYLLTRPPPAAEVVEEDAKAGRDDGEKNAEPASTVGDEGKAGGEGEKERQRAPDPDQGNPAERLPEKLRVGLNSDRAKDAIAKVQNRGGFDKKLGKALARITGDRNDGSMAGYGTGSGTGVGPEQGGTGTLTKGTGKGTGGGGTAHEDVRTQGKINTGGKRAARGSPGGKGVKEVSVKVKTGTPKGNFGGLTPEQILKVVKSRQRAIQSCYTRELQRSKGLGGRIEVAWQIDSSGRVSKARVKKTTMRNGRVEDCVVRQVQSLKFPSPKNGGRARVNFPFIFAQQ